MAGCNRQPFDLAPVHGKVTVDERPLFQGKVLFAPIVREDNKNPGKPALGKIQSDGSYRLTTFDANDGAVIGQHWVTIINSEENLPDGVPAFSRVTAPERVSVVPGEDNQIDIKLTGKIVRENREDDR